jgi:glycosyltransferase involved in cell wall biosynthesis
MKHCLIFHFWADIDTNPTLMGLMRSLIGQGFDIDIICETRDFFLPPSLPHEHVTMHPVSSWRNCAQQLQEQWYLKLQQKKYSFIIAVDPQALYAGRYLLRNIVVPLIYLSFEILFWDELEKIDDFKLKENEIELLRQASLIIIQDKERAGKLATENKLEDIDFLYLPNAPRDEKRLESSSFLRDKFNISSSKKIILHTGSFDFWTAGEELIAATEKFPDDYILIIHSRQIPGKEDFITQMQSSCDPTKVIFSTDPLPFDDYAKLVESCDIGLVLYKISPTIFTQKNLYHIGLSSGKFSYFARHGKPVITTDFPSFQAILNEYQNGLCVRQVSDIGDILQANRAGFSEMGQNNRRFFKERLDFSMNIIPIIERLYSISNE